ncbi:hypothetical protein [Desulfosarcina cetonica]|uniref:hypothetical protein n=1 Tax=Desulfosarcina cetonica TaxID=90730 RepID=UPI0012ED2E72|nr:hypothetical protein [Desulfosarcina cetonica]
MKPRPASIVQRPFADLGQRLAAKQVRLPAVRLPDPPARLPRLPRKRHCSTLPWPTWCR